MREDKAHASELAMIGQTVSHYRIDAELGRGGMGVVYRAYDERLRRNVALKLLPNELAGQAERRARVLAEARAASALNHPGITTIYEVGEHSELLFIVMELVSGRTLRSMISEARMDARKIAQVSAQVAEALAAAHVQGVIHGDIKPENISVTTDDRVKLLDFGIARQAAAEAVTSTHTSSISNARPDSHISGTLAYMSPELLRGAPTDARSDLFSLGVVIYEMVSGHRPFPGPTATALMAQILHDAPAPLAAAAPLAPPELARMVHKLLEKNPDARYQSARELHADLNNLAREIDLGPALPSALAGKRAVAVLPFTLLTPNPADDYLGVALADAVINHLSAGGELLVRPTSTVMRYAGQTVEPRHAARELNVQVVVQGSIQKVGARLRAHVQAWNAADGATLCSAKRDAEMSEVFTLQDQLGDDLACVLGAGKPTATPAREEPPTRNQVAYELYLRAAERLLRLNRWDARTAIEMLENAVRLDPRFAVAWARLAEACVLMAVTFDPGPHWFRRADTAIRKSLALDPHIPEAECARGRVLWTPAKGFKHRQALLALRKAQQLNPGCHPALVWQCLIFMHIGLLDQARAGLLRALATHPDDAFVLVFTGQTVMYGLNFEEADEFHSRAISVDRANLWANIFYPTIPLYRGRLDEAEEKIRTARLVLPDDPWLTSCESMLWVKRGEARRGEQLLERALKARKPLLHTHHLWHTAAAVYALLGKRQKAIAWLRKAATTGLPNYPAFRDDPHFEPLKNDPAFVKLLSSLRKEWEGYKEEFGGA